MSIFFGDLFCGPDTMKLPSSLQASGYGVVALGSLVAGGSFLYADIVMEEIKFIATPKIEERFHIDLSQPMPSLDEFKQNHGKFVDLLFNTFDKDHNGEVDSQEFREGLLAFFEELIHDLSYIANDALASHSKAYSLLYERKHIPKGNVKKEVVLGMQAFTDDGKIKIDGIDQREKELDKVEDYIFHVFDVNHDNKISRDEAFMGMHKVLGSVHKFFDDIEENASKFKYYSAGCFLLSALCAYKHFTNAE